MSHKETEVKQAPKEESLEGFNELAKTLTQEPQTEADILAERAKDRNLVDAEELISHALVKKRLELPSIGAYVEYMPLRAKDKIEIASIVDKNPEIQRDNRNRQKVFLLLNRADGRYTMDSINNMAASIVDAILMEYEIQEDTRFLLPILNRRSDGMRRTLRHKS